MKINITDLIIQNDIEGIRKFIADGGDINMQDLRGGTALMFASALNSPEIVKTLIKGGAKLDIQDRRGDTALDVAKIRNLTEIIEILTEAKKPKEGKAVSPTSKVIQITTTEKLNDVITTALCENGSVWRYADKEWICILEAPDNDEIEEIPMFRGTREELEDLCSFK